MVNLILNLNIRVKWVADTKINRLENVSKFWDVCYVNDYGDVSLTNPMYNARITVILNEGLRFSRRGVTNLFVALLCSIR